jgi:hypothetical protein
MNKTEAIAVLIKVARKGPAAVTRGVLAEAIEAAETPAKPVKVAKVAAKP